VDKYFRLEAKRFLDISLTPAPAEEEEDEELDDYTALKEWNWVGAPLMPM